jgi:hypothetical protein
MAWSFLLVAETVGAIRENHNLVIRFFRDKVRKPETHRRGKRDRRQIKTKPLDNRSRVARESEGLPGANSNSQCRKALELERNRSLGQTNRATKGKAQPKAKSAQIETKHWRSQHVDCLQIQS